MNIQKYNTRLRTYILNTGALAAGANKVMMDLYNPVGSGVTLLILAAFITPETDAAVTGVVSARFDLYRTSTPGTGGTGHSYQASDPSTINISPTDTSHPVLPPGLGARQLPTGGCAKIDWLNSTYVFPEETDAASISQQFNDILPTNAEGSEPIAIHEGQGIMFQQGAVVSVNNYIFEVVFATSGNL